MTPPSTPHLLRLPDELLLPILAHAPPARLLDLRLVCRRFSSLALAPSLHRDLSLTSIPVPVPPLLAQLARHARRLALHPFPYPGATAVLALLDAIDDGQLEALSMPFAPPHVTAALGPALARVGGRLAHLDLRGTDLSFLEPDWLDGIGAAGPGAAAGLRTLDLGYTSLPALPLAPLRALTRLSLSFAFVPLAPLTRLIAALPPTIEKLDLSRLPHLPLAALMALPVVTADGPTALREVCVIGIDHLTRTDIRRLQRHWDDQRRRLVSRDARHVAFVPVRPRSPRTPEPRSAALLEAPPTPPDSSEGGDGRAAASARVCASPARPPTPPSEDDDDAKWRIRIVHSAILESEDEAGYRQFIGEVVGGTIERVPT